MYRPKLCACVRESVQFLRFVCGPFVCHVCVQVSRCVPAPLSVFETVNCTKCERRESSSRTRFPRETHNKNNMAGSGGTSLAAAFAAAAKRHELRELMTTKRTNSILERRPGMLPLRTLQLGPPADASSSVSPANSEHHRFAAALQAERLELSSENARLRRRVSELEQSVQLMQATAGAQRWLKSQGSGGATSWPPTATARVNSTAPKLRPKPTPCTIGPTSLHHRQILDAVERSQAEVASRPPPSPGESEQRAAAERRRGRRLRGHPVCARRT